MAKITVGKSWENSITRVGAELSHSSNMELNIGDSHDMSVREITIIEREASEISHELSCLRELANEIQKNNPSSPEAKAIDRETTKLAETAERVINERKWYSVSAKGLIEAAQAVGSTASPLVDSALKIVKLLKQAQS